MAGLIVNERFCALGTLLGNRRPLYLSVLEQAISPSIRLAARAENFNVVHISVSDRCAFLTKRPEIDFLLTAEPQSVECDLLKEIWQAVKDAIRVHILPF